MRILCCPVNLHPATARSLELHASDADIVPIAKGDDLAYWRAIRERWNGSDSLVIVEHDIAFTAGQLETFRTCPEPWCLFGYQWKQEDVYLRDSLGFTRYSAELMTSVPVQEIGPDKIPSMYEVTLKYERDSVGDIEIDWYHIDRQVSYALRSRGFSPHVHGTVEHFHDPTDTRRISPQ